MILGKNIDLRLIEASDAEFVLSLRLDPKLNQYISIVENNIEKQKDWIKACKNNTQEWYFIVQNKQGNPVGTIRIYDVKDDSFCWGSWVIKPAARSYASFESVVLIHEYAFFELGFNTARVDARKSNKKSVDFQLRFGASFVKEDELNYYFLLTKERYNIARPQYLDVIATKNIDYAANPKM